MSEKPRAKAYVYTRVSTAMQVDGFSLDAQRDEIRQFAELKKIDIVGEYCDEGKSGKDTRKRTEFNRMLTDINFNGYNPEDDLPPVEMEDGVIVVHDEGKVFPPKGITDETVVLLSREKSDDDRRISVYTEDF